MPCFLSWSLFQSLEGIWGFWNPSVFVGYRRIFYVSIPGRDLGVLERDIWLSISQWSCFNPWKGFGGFGTFVLPYIVRRVIEFQSLEGIWGFWNAVRDALRQITDLFQSLEGIWGFWNVAFKFQCVRNFGFNPWKGFGGFGTKTPDQENVPPEVSIPGRDLGVLEHRDSNSGIAHQIVSIPGRDLGVLELVGGALSLCPSYVSIPGRDLGVLERLAVKSIGLPW